MVASANRARSIAGLGGGAVRSALLNISGGGGDRGGGDRKRRAVPCPSLVQTVRDSWGFGLSVVLRLALGVTDGRLGICPAGLLGPTYAYYTSRAGVQRG